MTSTDLPSGPPSTCTCPAWMMYISRPISPCREQGTWVGCLETGGHHRCPKQHLAGNPHHQAPKISWWCSLLSILISASQRSNKLSPALQQKRSVFGQDQLQQKMLFSRFPPCEVENYEPGLVFPSALHSLVVTPQNLILPSCTRSHWAGRPLI